MFYLIVILAIITGILIWQAKRISDLEKKVDEFLLHLENLSTDISEENDMTNDIFDNIFRDIKIIRQHTGLEPSPVESMKEVREEFASTERRLEDLPF